MARISTVSQRRHREAEALLASDDVLTFEQKTFIYENYHEGATNLNGLNGAFFTPPALACDFATELHGNRVIDLCAGIGMLGHASTLFMPDIDLTCVELCPAYVKAGKRLVPHATWHCESATQLTPREDKFDLAISNPPFGNIDGIKMFDLEVVRIASTIANHGLFILPQQSTPFRYSGSPYYREETTDALARWMDKTGIEFEFNCGIDCNQNLSGWKGVKPVVEIVLCDFTIAQDVENDRELK
jgi:predicted RNA methylase